MVNRELDIATDHHLAIIPFRIEDITPSGQTKFYLAGIHWLDAMTPPLEQHLESLVAAVKPLLDLVGQRKEVETPVEGLDPSGGVKGRGRGQGRPASLPGWNRNLKHLLTPKVVNADSGSRNGIMLPHWRYLGS